jgi:peroxiredoxin
MRKTLFILAAFAITLTACNKEKQYIINGTIAGIENGKASLQVYEQGKWVTTDSAVIKEGKFVFKGKVQLPEMRYLVIDGISDNFPFFVENSKIALKVKKDSIDKSEVTGSATHALYLDYQKQVATIDANENVAYENYKKAKQAGNLADIKKYDSIATLFDKDKGKVMMDFVVKNPKSVVGPYLVISNSWQFELTDLESVISGIDTSLKNSGYVIKIKDRIEILKKVAVGQVAPDFSLTDSTGKAVSLSSFRGQLILVDFWASWCSPCRAENPNFVAIYKEFHPNGFQMLGVSLDKDRAKWLKAIRDDKLTWNHISDLKGWECAASQLYGINSIPANVLVDPEGKIIARNIFGDELRKKLKELLK